MKRIPIQLSLWSPPVRVMQASPVRRSTLTLLGQTLIGGSSGGLLTILTPVNRQYRIS